MVPEAMITLIIFEKKIPVAKNWFSIQLDMFHYPPYSLQNSHRALILLLFYLLNKWEISEFKDYNKFN